MEFFHLRLRDDQANFLRKLPGATAEHIRQAVDDYIRKLSDDKSSLSLSERVSKITDETLDKNLPDLILGNKSNG